MARERKRVCELDAPGPPKRVRTSCGNMTISFGDDSPSVYRREVLFKYIPSSILSLAHAAQRIDALLMSPEEAVLEAVKSEQHDWLNKLKETYSSCVPGALVLAAKRGCVGIARTLLTENELDVREAAMAAAENGHLEVVELLVEQIEPHDRNLTVWRVMDAAARKGHLDIVTLATERARQEYVSSFESGSLPACHLTHALLSAIAGRHLDVVAFLLSQGKFQWDRGAALDQAVALGQQRVPGVAGVLDLIIGAIAFSIDPYCDDHDDLLAHAVRRGLLNAVKYEYEHSRNTIKRVEHCFVIAAEHSQIRILQFFLDTNRVSKKTFDRAFIAAASFGSVDTVVFLHELKRASSKSITKIIQLAARKRVDCGGDIVKFLFDKGDVTEEEAITAFETAASNNNADVVKQLFDIASIPNDIAVKALKVAATRGHLAVVNSIRFGSFASADVITEVFMSAVRSKRELVVKALVDDERISPETVTKAFGDASSAGCTRILRVLNTKQNASPEAFGQFINNAANQGHVSVVKYLSKNPIISEAVKTQAQANAQRFLYNKLYASSQQRTPTY